VIDHHLVVGAGFEGMPGIALGGYSAGLLARAIGANVEVVLRRPIKVGAELEVVSSEGGVLLRDDESIYAEGQASGVAVDVPLSVDTAAAEVAALQSPGFGGHFFPRCFSCGPSREPRDGLRIFPGRLGATNVVAAPWTPHEALATEDGYMPLEILWAALDCPGIWALIISRSPDSTERAVTGKMAVAQRGSVQAGQPHVVLAWPMGGEGRKLFAGAAILSAGGEVLCVAKQTMMLTEKGVPLRLDSWRGAAFPG